MIWSILSETKLVIVDKLEKNGFKLLIQMQKFKFKRKSINFTTGLLNDLQLSVFLTTGVYYLFLFVFYVLILMNKLNDPSQNGYKFKDNVCTQSEPFRPDETNNLNILATIADSVLNKTNLSYFLCYRTLYDVVKLKSDYHDIRNLDICLYDKNFNTINSLASSLIQYLIPSQIERDLDALKEKFLFDYEYDELFGYYKLYAPGANLFIYLMVHSPPTKLEFERARRYGLFYIQFAHLTNLLQNKKRSSYQENRPYSSLLDLPTPIPIYMLDNLVYKVKIAKNYFLVPNDPLTMLMFLYPKTWFLTSEKCTF